MPIAGGSVVDDSGCERHVAGIYRRQPRDEFGGSAYLHQIARHANHARSVVIGPRGSLCEQRLHAGKREREQQLQRVDHHENRWIPTELEDADERDQVREKDRGESETWTTTSEIGWEGISVLSGGFC